MGPNSGACQPWKSPCHSEGEGDKISHKNTSLVISYFLVRMLLSNGSECAYSTSMCLCEYACTCTCVCARAHVCAHAWGVKKRESERSNEKGEKTDLC